MLVSRFVNSSLDIHEKIEVGTVQLAQNIDDFTWSSNPCSQIRNISAIQKFTQFDQ